METKTISRHALTRYIPRVPIPSQSSSLPTSADWTFHNKFKDFTLCEEALRPPKKLEPNPKLRNRNTNLVQQDIASAIAHNSTSPPILKLPAELRDKIYDFAVVSKEPFRMTLFNGPKQPALLAVCRQIRVEALSIWFEENSFLHEETPGTFGSFELTRVLRWLTRIGPERSAKIKLVLSHSPHYCVTRRSAMANAENLVQGLLAAGVVLERISVERTFKHKRCCFPLSQSVWQHAVYQELRLERRRKKKEK